MARKKEVGDVNLAKRKVQEKVQKTNVEKSSNHNIKYVLVIFFVILILTFLAVYMALAEREFEKIPTCGDGTFYDTCSLDRPYYCEEGILTEKASLCGCGEVNSNLVFEKKGEFCFLDHNTEHKDVPLSYVLNSQRHEINFTVYKGVYDYVSDLSRVIYFKDSEIPFRVDFKIKSISDEVQRANIMPLVKKIQNLAPDSKTDQARIAISIVQNIPYGISDKKFFFEGQKLNHSRNPYEVLFDNQGICGEKSLLLAFLLKELGFGTSIFYFAEENHEAVGIKCPVEYSLYGSGYCFVETGGPAIISDISIEFAEGVKLESRPEIMLISKGISLPDNLREYKDTKTLRDVREKNIFGILKSWRYRGIIDRYQLDEVYVLG